MRVFITGGTGLVGRRLVRRLLDRGDRPVILSRRPVQAGSDPALAGAQVVGGDPSEPGSPWSSAIEGCDAVVNLVGHNVFGERWSGEVRRKIRSSRVDSTRHLVEAIGRRPAGSRPGVLVQGSAVGYYGSRGDEVLDESAPPGQGFLADVCRDWEAASEPAEALGLRRAVVRIGVVLAEGEGALGVMAPIFRWLPGGAAPVGNGGRGPAPARGRQWVSWIHADDLVGLLLLCLDHPGSRGPLNGTAPNPVRNAEFGRELARVVRRPFLPFGPPDFVLRLVLGGVADVVINGQRAIPTAAPALGFGFTHPEVGPALRAALGRPEGAGKTGPAPLAAPGR